MEDEEVETFTITSRQLDIVYAYIESKRRDVRIGEIFGVDGLIIDARDRIFVINTVLSMLGLPRRD